MKILLSAGAVVLTVWCAALNCNVAAAQTPAVTATKVRVHHVGVLSKGPLVATNKEALSNAQAYFDKVNRSGGVNGRQIEMVMLDDQQEPTLADELSKQALDRNEVLAFFLGRTSPTHQMLMKNAQPLGIPIIAPQVGPNFLYDPKQTVAYTVRASYEAELLRAIELQLKFARKKFAFLSANDAYGNPLVDAAAKQLAGVGLKPIVEKVDNRAADIAPGLKSFLEQKPDVIFLLCSTTCAADFVKKYKAAGGSTQFITLSNNSSNAFLKGLGEAGRGIIVMQVMPLPTSKTVRLSKDYAKLCAESKIEPSYNGLVAFVGARVLVEAIKRTGKNLNPESLKTALAGMRGFDLGDFVISFGPDDRIGSEFVEETIISKDGKFLR
jgi:branched-chain amino acid transport system substrate-binding protein